MKTGVGSPKLIDPVKPMGVVGVIGTLTTVAPRLADAVEDFAGKARRAATTGAFTALLCDTKIRNLWCEVSAGY